MEDKTVYATVELETPAFASGRINHLEFFSGPPNFRFEDLNQVCFVGFINGGDSIMFRNITELNTWLVDNDIISMNELDNRIERMDALDITEHQRDAKITDHIHGLDELCSGCIDQGYVAGEEAAIELVMSVLNTQPHSAPFHMVKRRFSEEFFPINDEGLMIPADFKE